MIGYVPIVRNRQSEIRALGALSAEVKTSCQPLLDLAAPTRSADQKAAVKFVANAAKRTAAVAHEFPGVFLDSSELDPQFRLPNDVHPLLAAATEILDEGGALTPVTALHRDDDYQAACDTILDMVSDKALCIRLDVTDISTASATYREVANYLAQRSLDSEDVHLLLDFQSVFGRDAQQLAALAMRFLRHASSRPWASVIVSGYGIPDQVNQAVSVNGQGYIPRTEWEVFQSVQSEIVGLPIRFGDYTTVAPTHVELDWRIIRKVSCPKIIYALSDSWFVCRGSPFSTNPKGYEQYHDLAVAVAALDEFKGRDFSYGDQYVAECADRTASTGSQSSWIVACVNHHVALTASALDVAL